jgi:hypothetical protein
MGSSCPPHWSFAARAAYFGDRLCAFCDHRNPPGARFCNDCASPLDLKPCRQCDGVNDQAAPTCHRCGASYPESAASGEMALSSAADAPPGRAPPGDAAVAEAVPGAPAGLRAGWRLLTSREFLGLAAAVVLIVGAHEAYRASVAKPDAIEATSQPVAALAQDAISTTDAEATVAESTTVDEETATDVQVGAPENDVAAPQRAAVRRTSSPVAAKARANARQRPAPERQVPVGATTPVTQRLAPARVGVRAAQAGRSPPDRWQLMQASVARCGGDLLARVVCEQRVRRHYCEGHWGVAPACASGIVNEHGQ